MQFVHAKGIHKKHNQNDDLVTRDAMISLKKP